jgi:threonine/homoserine/homoserine lactone efflux protein
LENLSHLWLFFVLVFGVILLPGLDMAFVLATSLVGGLRAAFVGIAGIIAGAVFHVAMGALGIMAVLRLIPAAFNAVLLAGALYIAWIGISLVRSRTAFGELPREQVASLPAIFRRGLVTAVLNPKAYLFTLAVFPQFVKPEASPLWMQAVLMWLIVAITQLAVYGATAIAGDRARAWLSTRPAANALLARSVGVMLLAIATYTAYEGWRTL